ncbi:hypothetical protein [Pseudonocardia sp. GCM10023141]|uniref:hypothetical protein n=1 Tax=Pseudonocardia sp. GCM10023141 TaxID=3252653 RepID=UPI003609288C
MGTFVIVLEAVAVAVAVLAFGWPVLLVGVPLLVGTLIVLVVVGLSEGPRRKLAAHRAARHVEPAPQGGLMSGFFEIPRQSGPVEAPNNVRR